MKLKYSEFVCEAEIKVLFVRFLSWVVCVRLQTYVFCALLRTRMICVALRTWVLYIQLRYFVVPFDLGSVFAFGTEFSIGHGLSWFIRFGRIRVCCQSCVRLIMKSCLCVVRCACSCFYIYFTGVTLTFIIPIVS